MNMTKGESMKFKVWDKFAKKFVDHVYIGLNGKVRYFGYEGDFEEDDISQFSIAQWTGLLDKNGKEIYEGDVIQSEINNPARYAVEFIEGCFCATNPKLENYPTDLNHFYCGDSCIIEVIGNIYEHPELTQGEK